MNFRNLTIIDGFQIKYIDSDLRELTNLYSRRFSNLIKIKFDIIQRFSVNYKILKDIFTRSSVKFIY
jgi:hypothetical protein